MHLEHFTIYNRKPASIGLQSSDLSEIDVRRACGKMQLLGGINKIEKANINLIELIRNYDEAICGEGWGSSRYLLNVAVENFEEMNVEYFLEIAEEEYPDTLKTILTIKDQEERNILDFTNYLLTHHPGFETLEEIKEILISYGAKPTPINPMHEKACRAAIALGTGISEYALKAHDTGCKEIIVDNTTNPKDNFRCQINTQWACHENNDKDNCVYWMNYNNEGRPRDLIGYDLDALGGTFKINADNSITIMDRKTKKSGTFFRKK
jgi:hypothetical protein